MEVDILEINCDYNIETDCDNNLNENQISNENKEDTSLKNDPNNVISQICNIGNYIDNTIYQPHISVDVDPNIILNVDELNVEDENDVLFNTEIQNIIENSYNNIGDSIIGYDKNKKIIFPIPINFEISSRLIDYLWNKPCIEKNEPLKFQNQDSFEKYLGDKYKNFTNEHIGFFGFHYWKSGKTFKLTHKDGKFGNKPESPRILPGCFVFDDFSLVIMKSGKVVDYAIHGVENNINEVIRKYQPSVILYPGREEDPISTFLKYKYQPFSEFSNTFIPIQFNKFKKYRVIQNCNRLNEFCSFCNVNQFILNYYDYKNEMNQTNEHKIMTIGEYSKIKNNSNRFKYHKIEKKFQGKRSNKKHKNLNNFNRNPHFFQNKTNFNNYIHNPYYPYYPRYNQNYIHNFMRNNQFIPNHFIQNV